MRLEKLHDKVKETYFKMVDRGTVPREMQYRTVIENLKEKPVHLWLLDRVPVSKTDKIQVKNLEMTPRPTEEDYHKRKGVQFWDIEVPAEATVEIHIDFVVTHPKHREPVYL